MESHAGDSELVAWTAENARKTIDARPKCEPLFRFVVRSRTSLIAPESLKLISPDSPSFEVANYKQEFHWVGHEYDNFQA
jgi:hypothetical protein